MDSYTAQLQKIKAQRQAQLGEIQQQTDETLPMYQQDRNRTALMAEQNKRRIRDLMARLNTVGGGQQINEEIDNGNDTSNALNASYDKEKAFKNAQASKMQNLNNEFDAAESGALADYQQQLAAARKSSLKEDGANELNSVYVALNQAMRGLSGKEFLDENEDEILARFGPKVLDDMKARVQAENMDTQRKLTGKNINTTPQTYSGNIYS